MCFLFQPLPSTFLALAHLLSALNVASFFYDYHCFIQDRIQALTIGRGRRHNNLYVLSLGSDVLNSPVIGSVLSKTDLWHCRLGHPSLVKLQVLNDILRITGSLSLSNSHCSICPLAKQRRLPFHSQNKMSENCFDLIHIDIWGPFHIQTHEGFRYFVTIVDDCSRVTWVYLLRAKSDGVPIFKNFYAMVLTQYNTKIKSVRSDNAPELFFHDFFSSKGINSTHSCVETPEQNSVVE